MPKIEAFDTHATQYELWFEKHKYLYESEVEALRILLPKEKQGVEIGVGTGRFAKPLGIQVRH